MLFDLQVPRKLFVDVVLPLGHEVCILANSALGLQDATCSHLRRCHYARLLLLLLDLLLSGGQGLVLLAFVPLLAIHFLFPLHKLVIRQHKHVLYQ